MVLLDCVQCIFEFPRLAMSNVRREGSQVDP